MGTLISIDILRHKPVSNRLTIARSILQFTVCLLTIGSLLASAATPTLAAVQALAAAPLSPSVAPVFTVNSLVDVPASAPLNNGVCETLTSNHICTLRAAIMKANHYPGGGVTINLPANTYDLAITPTLPSDDETMGDLNITASLTLNGAGTAVTIIDAHQLARVFNIDPGASVTISHITVQGGLEGEVGGGVLNNGTLTLNDDLVTGNQTSNGSAGSGIANDNSGVMTLNKTTVTGNVGTGNAGGIYNDNNATLTLNNSIISDNQALNGSYAGGLLNNGIMTLNNSLVSGNQATGKGGGIWNASGTLSITNSTVSNNSAILDGGGIYNWATLNTDFTTIAGNLADSEATGAGMGGGIINDGGIVNLKTTLFAQNFVAATPSDGFGTIHSLDYNLFQDLTNVTLTGVTTHNALVSDPLLDSPHFNGGFTPTRALLTGSPALDAVPSTQCTDLFGATLTIDQRGYHRPAGGACDIGAFEGQQPLLSYLRNLVRNGDAEGAAGSPDGAFVGAPDWQTNATLMTTTAYNSSGFPSSLTDPVPPDHGDNFFAGGVSAGAGGTQTIDVTSLSPGIDGGGVSYDFSAYLGGFLTQSDNATVEADFLNGSFSQVGQVILGPVSAADRGNLTGLLLRSASGPVPMNTRYVELFINLSRVNSTYNDGYIDNISLVFLPRATVFVPLVEK